MKKELQGISIDQASTSEDSLQKTVEKKISIERYFNSKKRGKNTKLPFILTFRLKKNGFREKENEGKLEKLKDKGKAVRLEKQNRCNLSRLIKTIQSIKINVR